MGCANPDWPGAPRVWSAPRGDLLETVCRPPRETLRLWRRRLPTGVCPATEAGVQVHTGPVSGHVVVGGPPPVVVCREPVREVIVVEQVHVPHGHGHHGHDEDD